MAAPSLLCSVTYDDVLLLKALFKESVMEGYVDHCRKFTVCWFAERFKDSVIEERKKSVEELLHFVSSSPHLVKSSPMLAFLGSL